MLFRTIYYRETRKNGWSRPCILCGVSPGKRIIFVSKDQSKKISVCTENLDCVKRIFPTFNELEDRFIHIGMYSKLRDRGLQCSKCGKFIDKGIILITRASLRSINNFKKGTCSSCLGGEFEKAVQ